MLLRYVCVELLLLLTLVRYSCITPYIQMQVSLQFARFENLVTIGYLTNTQLLIY